MIKFRGQSIMNKRILYGDLLHNSGELLILEPSKPAETIIKGTLAQFVAYDKLGNEMYTDDIAITNEGIEICVAKYFTVSTVLGDSPSTIDVVLKDYNKRIMEQRNFTRKETTTKQIEFYESIDGLFIQCGVSETTYWFERYCCDSKLFMRSVKFSNLINQKKFWKNYKAFAKKVKAMEEPRSSREISH